MTKNELYSLINKYYEKVFILTIEEAVERHQHIKEHLYGLNYEFVFGVNKEYVNSSFQSNDLSHLDPNFISDDSRYFIWNDPKHINGIAACAEGHKRIYDKIVSGGLKNALIFEDDVVLDERVCSKSSFFLKKIPSHWEVIYFGYTGGVRENPNLSFPIRYFFYHVKKIFGLYRRFNQPISRPVNGSFDTSGYQAGCYAYALTNEAAQKLLTVQSPLTFSADGALIFLIRNKLLRAFVHKNPLFTDATYFNAAIKLPSLINYKKID